MTPREPPTTPSREQRFEEGTSLRRLAARGTIINSTFLTAVNLLGMLRGVLVAGILGTRDYGVWAVLIAVIATLFLLKQVGIGERFVQQDEADQEAEFQKAMTLEVAVSLVFVAIGVGFVLVYAAVMDLPEIVGPGLLILGALPLGALQFPLSVFYRRMDFLRQRQLQAVDPLVSFVTTIGLALAGAGYWSLVVGTVAGSGAAAVMAIRACPYRLRPRFEFEALRRYAGFSWPIFAGGVASIVTVQGLTLVGEAEVGLTGLGIIALVTQISQFADRADRAVTETLYPALCAVKDRTDLLFESFVKSNRLALIWGLPFGLGLALFAEDLLVRLLGAQWEPGVELMQLVAVALGIHQIGFNWSAFYRARGDTRPMAVAAGIGIAAFFALPLPLLATHGLKGLGWGVLGAEMVAFAVRGYYLRRLFPALRYGRHIARAVVPTLPGVTAVLAFRAATSLDRTLWLAAAEAVVFAIIVLGLTWRLERPLLKEIRSYVSR
jgi:O-antigen/teichoic acid export membrane protein